MTGRDPRCSDPSTGSSAAITITNNLDATQSGYLFIPMAAALMRRRY
jgi:hypothetical protein